MLRNYSKAHKGSLPLKLSTLLLAAGHATSPDFKSAPLFPGYLSPDEECSNFNGEVGCTSGDQTRYPDEWSKRSF